MANTLTTGYKLQDYKANIGMIHCPYIPLMTTPIVNPRGNQVWLVIGLPGSGKTWYIYNRLIVSYPDAIIIDDPTDMIRITECIEQGKNMIISDPHLCNPKIRDKAIDFFHENGIPTNLICFENDQEKCKKNLAYRNDGRNIQELDAFQYEIPGFIQPMTIWQPPN